MVWRRWQSQQARRLFRYTFLLLLPFIGPLLALAACGAAPLPVTHRLAADLRLAIRIYGQYRGRYSEHYGENVWAEVRVFDGTDKGTGSRGFALADKARLTCNGNDITIRSPAASAAGGGACPRQAPGGSYQITYTDEHGASTSVIVPVPTGTFSMLSPLAGSTVPMPVNGVFTVRVSLPEPPPNGTVVVESVYAHCGLNCSAVSANLPNDATPTVGPDANAASSARIGGDRGIAPNSSGLTFFATPTPPATLTPGPTPPPAATLTPAATATERVLFPPATATMTQDGSVGTITLQGDFSAFRPISGEVGANVEVRIAPDAGGFAAVTAVIGSEDIYSAITWTR
jgi:hypothetical protein